MPPNLLLKCLAQEYLATTPFKAGETVQLGWFVFRIVDNNSPPELEMLDFVKMASFTADFSKAEEIREQQTAILTQTDSEAEECTHNQAAFVSRSYAAGHPKAFMERQAKADNNDSGWYVGVKDDERSMKDLKSFGWHSLYELSIADPRMLPYWMLPVGKRVFLSSGLVESV